MIGKVDRKQAYRELNSIIKRLRRAETELDKLSAYKHRFPKQFLSIETNAKSPAMVDEVEKELKQIVIMIERYQRTEYQNNKERKKAANPRMADREVSGYPIHKYR